MADCICCGAALVLLTKKHSYRAERDYLTQREMNGRCLWLRMRVRDKVVK